MILSKPTDIARIPPESARAYALRAKEMAHRVSQLLMNHPRIGEFLTEAPFRLIEVNHRNHSAFIAEILRTNDFELLARTLPWVYYAYHNQGVSYDYFPAEFEAWKQAIQEELPAIHQEPLLALYDWMLAAHEDTLAAAERFHSPEPPVPADLHSLYPRFVDALIACDHVTLIDISQALLDQGLAFHQLLQGLFFPAMVEVGTRWEQGRLSVAGEHQATSTAYLALSTLYYDRPFPTRQRGKAIVASVVNEFHELGAWMVATCLDLDGWEITFLGSDCDQNTLIEKTVAESPRFIALSIGLLSHLEGARETIAALRGALGPDSATPILVGGRALLSVPSLVESLGADLVLTDCEAAVVWARSLDEGSPT